MECGHSAVRRNHTDEKQATSAGTSRDRIVAEDCRCGARRIDQQMGLEATPALYLERMVAVFREVRRVMRDDAVCFINMGDSYLDKQLVGMPWRLALALQDDGWWLRSEIIWNKPNPMPESIQGSHATRHRVTLAEYERLSGLRTAEGGDEDGASNLPGLRTREVSGREAPLPAEREGQGNGTRTRGTGRGQGEAASVLGVRARTGEQAEVPGDDTWEGDDGPAFFEPSSEGSAGGRDSDGGGLDSDPRSEPAPLFLLQDEALTADDGPRDSSEQGWQALAGEHRPGVPVLQLEEERQDRDALLDCPGCPKCAATNGYILTLSAGRPTKAHEQVFLLTKSARYFYDADAIREEGSGLSGGGFSRAYAEAQPNHGGMRLDRPEVTGRNARTVWSIATQPYSEAHFATFPEELPRRCILAGTSERGVCPQCGAPWTRVVETRQEQTQATNNHGKLEAVTNWDRERWPRTRRIDTTTGWQPSCSHALEPQPATVLDPFLGSGTTVMVALQLGRSGIGIELSPTYADLARRRILDDHGATVPLNGATPADVRGVQGRLGL